MRLDWGGMGLLAGWRDFNRQVVGAGALPAALANLNPVNATFAAFPSEEGAAWAASHLPGRGNDSARRCYAPRVRYFRPQMLPLPGANTKGAFGIAGRKLDMDAGLGLPRADHRASLPRLRFCASYQKWQRKRQQQRGQFRRFRKWRSREAE